MSQTVRPTAQVETFVRILGQDLAVEFLLTFGGAELYLSPNPRANSELAKLVGVDLAKELYEASERLPRRIPTARPWIAKVLAAKQTEDGQKLYSKSAIARKLHVSDVTVRKWLKGEGASPADDSRQLPLF